MVCEGDGTARDIRINKPKHFFFIPPLQRPKRYATQHFCLSSGSHGGLFGGDSLYCGTTCSGVNLFGGGTCWKLLIWVTVTVTCGFVKYFVSPPRIELANCMAVSPA